MPLQLAAATTLAIWLYLLLFRGGFWREFARRPGQPSAAPAAPRIVAIVPARDEADCVARAIGSLAAQRPPDPRGADCGARNRREPSDFERDGYFHIVLVDDHSSDGTAAIAAAAAPPDLLTVVSAAPLPAGWTGKLWAVAEGIRHAAPLRPDYLLLTDADIVHPPDNAANLAARAQSENYDLVSYMATLDCRTPAERALVPAFVFFFFLLYPPAWIRSARHTTAGAAGGCMLIRYRTLEKIGGIAAIRGELIDDCALASAVKRAGGRVWLGLDETTHSIRPYRTFGEMGRMISRSAFTQLHHSTLLLAGTVAGLLLTYLAPVLLTLFAPQPAAGMAAAAWLLMSLGYLPALRFYRRAWFAAPLLPLVALFYAGATVHSAISYWSGAGGQWKGRVQDG